MDITKSDIGKNLYFVHLYPNSDTVFIIEYGKLIGITPKFCFTDRYDTSFKREEQYLFEINQFDGETRKVAVSNSSLVSDKMDDLLKVFGTEQPCLSLNVFKERGSDIC